MIGPATTMPVPPPPHRLCPLLVAAALVACGGSPPAIAPPPPQETTSARASDEPELSIASEVGALDKEAVRAAAQGARRKATACIEDARAKIPYLGGDLQVYLAVDRGGRVVKAELVDNDLGHRDAEACVLDAFRGASWPRPVGGRIGEVRQELGYEAGYEPMPEVWGAGELAEDMGAAEFDAMKKALAACVEEVGARALSVTMYLDEDGFVQSFGLGGEGAADAATCVSTVVETRSFPSPGKLVKATVEVP